MKNFNQIQVGDEVHAVIIEETAVSLVPGGTAESVDEAAAVALAPSGEKPGLAAVTTRENTAGIVAIDAHAHRVTLEFIDGTTETVKVGKDFDLTTISLEDSVRVQITDAIGIAIAKKQD